MRPLPHRSAFAVATLATLAIVAGCSGSSQTALNPTAPSSSSMQRIGPSTTVSTVVGIKNDWIATISGSGSAPCWSISPGLPTVGPFGDLSGPVTLSYTPLCPTPGTLGITYGPPSGSSASQCTFTISYNGANFLYTVTQGGSTACSVAPSASTRYDEILTYAQKGPDSKRARSLHRARDAATSTSVAIDNTYSKEIVPEAVSSACLTGSPPDVTANSQSAPFTVSYTGTCASDHGFFDMTYGPANGVADDACKFNIDYTVSTGTFLYSVTNTASTNCSYHLGVTPNSVIFVYGHV